MLINTFHIHIKCHRTIEDSGIGIYPQADILKHDHDDDNAAVCQCTETFLKMSPQKFRRVRKEDAGEYYCQAKNDAGHAQCPPQMMEVCK